MDNITAIAVMSIFGWFFITAMAVVDIADLRVMLGIDFSVLLL